MVDSTAALPLGSIEPKVRFSGIGGSEVDPSAALPGFVEPKPNLLYLDARRRIDPPATAFGPVRSWRVLDSVRGEELVRGVVVEVLGPNMPVRDMLGCSPIHWRTHSPPGTARAMPNESTDPRGGDSRDESPHSRAPS